MCQNIKKGHNNNCHNHCRIHHNPDFLSYYQYPAFYGYGTSPLVQYSIPQYSYPPLFDQYQYSSIIQHPIAGGLQPNQGVMWAQPYQYIPNNIDQNLNNLPNNARINDNFYQQTFDEDYYLSHYNSRSPLRTGRYYDDFRRPVPSLSAEEEYNWAVHISEILDEFIGRNSSRPKSNFDEYQKLKHTLDTSLRHLKEVEALNQTLVKAWEKNDEKPVINSSETTTLLQNKTEDESTNSNDDKSLLKKSDETTLLASKLASKVEKSVALNEKKVVPVTIISEPENNSISSETSAKDKFDFLDFEDSLDNKINDSDHSFFFNDNEFMESDLLAKEGSDEIKDDNNVNGVVAEDINDFLGANLPNVDLVESNSEIIESEVLDEEIKFIDIDKVKDTKPVLGTYKDSTIKTSLGEVQASEIYPKIFDQYGHIKMDHFEAMAQFGLTEKQYDKLIDNFYLIKENKSKKNKKDQFGVVVKSKFNAKAFWITMTILGVILLLIGITTILYFTVPSIAEAINIVIDKIKKLF